MVADVHLVSASVLHVLYMPVLVPMLVPIIVPIIVPIVVYASVGMFVVSVGRAGQV